MSSQSNLMTSSVPLSRKVETLLDNKLDDQTYDLIITRQDAETLVKTSISPDHELIDYRLGPYSTGKLGFLALHQKLVIIAKKAEGNETDERSFFVKAMPQNPFHAAYVRDKGVFRKEADFFKYVVPLCLENYQGDPWAPRCYLVKENVIVLEDLGSRGFSNEGKIFDKETIYSATACIARFHACSMLAEGRLQGKTIQELYPHVVRESEFIRTEHSYKWFITAINLLISIANDLGLDSSRILPASERVFDEMAEPSKTKQNAINHGDLWSNNILFDKSGNCNIVDFQLLRYTPPAQDLMQLIYLTTTRQFRQMHERRVIEHYHKTMKETLLKNYYRGSVPTFKEICQTAEEQRFAALVMTALNYPTMMMKGQIAAEVMKGPTDEGDYFLKDRRPFYDKVAALDNEYRETIESVVRELTEMSILADTLPRPV